MDNVIFYQPPSTSASQPPRLPGVHMAAVGSGKHIASLSACQPASQLNQRNEMRSEQFTKCQHMSNVSPERHSPDQRYRNDPTQEKECLTTARNTLTDDINNDPPHIAELQSGIRQKNISTSGDPDRDDDDGFIDIDELLAAMKEDSISTCVKANVGGIVETDDNGTRGSSPVDSNHSTGGSTQDSMIPSDDEHLAADSETEYSEADLSPTTKSHSDSDSPHGAGGELADGDGFGSSTAVISDHLVIDHQDDDHNNGEVDGAKLQHATDSPRSASMINETRKRPVNTKIPQWSGNYVDLDDTKEVVNEGTDVFAKGDGYDDAYASSIERSRSSAVSCNYSDSSVPRLRNGQHGVSQSPRPGPAVASVQQFGLTNDPLQRPCRREDATANFRHQRLRTITPTGLASVVRNAAAVLQSKDLEEPQSVALRAGPGQERQLYGTDGQTTNDLTDEDYTNHSDTSSNAAERPPPSKRLRRAGNPSSATYYDPGNDSPCSSNLSSHEAAITLSTATPHSQEIPIRGFLTLKTLGSEVIYCLSFSQELSPQPGGTDASRSSGKRDSERSPLQERATSAQVRHSKFSPEDDELLRQLKEDECLSWDEIAEQFPERSKGTLQVHYSTKLKRHSGTSQKTTKRRKVCR